MAAKSLKQLKQDWANLNEAEDIKGATSSGGTGDYDGVSKKHDGEGGANLPHGGDNVKNVETQGKTDGVSNGAPTKFEPSNGEETAGKNGTGNSVSREAGASAGRAESGDGDKEGQDGAVDGANPVSRPEGAEGGPKDWNGVLGGSIAQFRDNVRKTLGLPLNDKLNQGNGGLNKDGERGGDIKKNLG